MSKENETQSSQYNIIAAGTKMTGDITSDTNFRLDGQINGTLKCRGKVIIGQNGAMEGTLECINAEILGKFTGKLVVTEALHLKATSRVEGEIKTITIINFLHPFPRKRTLSLPAAGRKK